jgi:predicted nucleotidyltransferase
MTNILADRRAASATRLQEFKNALQEAHAICDGKSCVYVTGSFGRGDASAHSDLDLFIVGKSTEDECGVESRNLPYLDEIRLKAELIEATRILRFPPFSGDGEYLNHYTIRELVKTTGKPEDDANNTFTARLLLLLESRPLVGDGVYSQAIDAAIEQYWRDYRDHEDKFVPAFLANDILRLWRTFCVDYEARTWDVPAEKKNKRRLKNYKLKYSRMLTCYSALIYLLVLHNQFGTVSPEDVRQMVAKSPTERLEFLLHADGMKKTHPVVTELLDMYSAFLENTDADERTMLNRISDKETRLQYLNAAALFGDSVFELIKIVGEEKRFHRLLVV